jgi:hypothetical protein
VHRRHDEPALVEFASNPGGVEVGDDVSVEVETVAGEVGELPVEQAGDPSSGFFDISAVVQAAVEEGEQAGGVAVAGDQCHPQARHAAQAGAPASVCFQVRGTAFPPSRVVAWRVSLVGDSRDQGRRGVLGDPRDRVTDGHVRQP